MLFIKYLVIFVGCYLIIAPPANAAPGSKNILGGRNPSFEKGISYWFLSSAAIYSIREKGKPGGSCGENFLRITQATDGEFKQLYHSGAKFGEDGLFKFSIRARVTRKGNQRPIISDLLASEIQRNGSMSLHSMAHNVRNTDGEWIAYSTTVQSSRTLFPKLGFYVEFFIPNGGKIDFDCARIERVS